ncbi:cytochrome P450 4ae1 isoform X1 [Musca domestica]|uniref:Cytochrome P450 4ae1 isoform X1 n=2 Tax=Musca domestica TaxID=7370 RepID=A0A9J7HZD2_MUSDO|nr:cytochrome P450 4ae1 isoform X1 [Musca domestica]XP_005177311.2 cytochrome P450 4ae1 isoform X1 [Musca domestica]XP_011296457.2 cytochrome P450 4ae1 isoform X1 [Musca domestica]
MHLNGVVDEVTENLLFFNYFPERSSQGSGTPCYRLASVSNLRTCTFVKMLWPILLAVFAILLVADYSRRQKVIATLGNIPLVSHIPFIGTIAVLFQLNPDNYDRKWHEFILRYGKTFGSFLLGMVFVVTTDHRIVDALLASNENLSKNFVYKMLTSWLGNGLLLSSGKSWQTMRKIITPTFHFKILEGFVEVFDRQSDALIAKLKSKADGITPVNIYEPVGLLTLDIIAETAMGVVINAQSDLKSDLIQAVNEVTDIMANRFVRPHLSFQLLAWNTHMKLKQGINVMHAFTERIIEERKQSLLHADARYRTDEMEFDGDGVGAKKRLAFLDVLLQARVDGQPLLDKQIHDEVNTFMFEGHDTTTSAISFCLYALSRHPEIQDKVFEEIRSNFGDDLIRRISYADLQKMNYLNCVIKESLRLFPPIPAVGRCLDRELKLDDCTIPRRANVVILLWEILRDPDNFVDPLSFKPDRHQNEGNTKATGYSNIPFSAGPRNCIGQRFALYEMRTILIKILRNFELLPLGEEVQVSMKIVLRSKNGVNIGLKPRQYQ